jgi:hypothetical protein
MRASDGTWTIIVEQREFTNAVKLTTPTENENLNEMIPKTLKY